MSSLRAVAHAADDPELGAAAQAARETFRYCWREVSWDQRRAASALDLAAVKVGLAEVGPDGEPVVEHLWVEIGAFDGTWLSGVLMNDPIDLSGPTSGTELALPLAEVEDWLYVIDGRAYGAFTVQPMRRMMRRRKRRAHDRAWGLDFRVPGTSQLMPVAERLQEGPAGEEHPMALASVEPFRATLTEDPRLATAVDDAGWTALHAEALAGNGAMVRLLLEHGADPAALTPAGDTAHDLAARVGWDHVCTILEER